MENNRIQTGTPYSLNALDQASHRHSWVDTGAAAAAVPRGSIADINAYNEVDSVNSSPVAQKKSITMELNFDAMKRALAEPTEASKREIRDRQKQLHRTFKDGNFDDLVRRTEPKHDIIQNRLNDLFTALAVERQITQVESKNQTANKPIYESHFPELFYY